MQRANALLISLLVLCGVSTLLLLGLLLHGALLASRAQQQRHGMPLRIVSKRWLTDDCFELVLRRRGFALLPAYQAGQYLTLLLPQAQQGRALRRCYSLAQWRRWPLRYTLCIKREADGLGSRQLAEHYHIGQTLRSLPPRGHFIGPKPGAPLLLIAGGIGITPLRAMLQAWQQQPQRGPVILFYAAARVADLAYHAELLALSGVDPRFTYRPCLSRDPSAPAAWQGRLSHAALSAALQADSHVYLCAGAALLQQTLAWLNALGVPAEQQHYEAFTALSQAGSGQFALDWQGQALSYQAEPSILHALHNQGVDLPADCWAGHCGSCRVRCQGQVSWRQTPGMRLASDEILPCCCVPLEPLQLSPS